MSKYIEKIVIYTTIPEIRILRETRRQEKDQPRTKPQCRFRNILPHQKLHNLLPCIIFFNFCLIKPILFISPIYQKQKLCKKKKLLIFLRPHTRSNQTQLLFALQDIITNCNQLILVLILWFSNNHLLQSPPSSSPIPRRCSGGGGGGGDPGLPFPARSCRLIGGRIIGGDFLWWSGFSLWWRGFGSEVQGSGGFRCWVFLRVKGFEFGWRIHGGDKSNIQMI